MKVGDRIRAEREAHGIGRREFAARIPMPYSTLAGIENGDQDGSTQLHAIAEALAVSPRWLETGRGPKRSDSVSPSQTAGLDAAKLKAALKFLEDVYRENSREFVASEQSLSIAAVYDELLMTETPNWVSLTVRFGKLLGGKDEREDKAGSAGKADQGRTRKRAAS